MNYFDPPNMSIYTFFIDCRELHLHTFCREIQQCAKIGRWGMLSMWGKERGQLILTKPGFQTCLVQ